MSLFKSGNPVLSEKRFENLSPEGAVNYGETMTVMGTLNKFGFLFLMVLGTSWYTWKEFTGGGNIMPFILTGIFGGFIVALVIIFKQQWAPYLAPLYALLEGLFIGAISAMYNEMFAEKAPNLIVNAVGLTFGVVIAMFFLYRFRIIKATERFKSVIITATMGIGLFYLAVMIMQFFGVQQMSFLHEGTTFGIIFSLAVVAVASLNLILDFDMIEKGSEQGAPKYMEWYGAFALLVTIIWLYLEILRLLSKLAGRK